MSLPHRLWLMSRNCRETESASAATIGSAASSLMLQWDRSRFCSRVNCDMSAAAKTQAGRERRTPPITASPKLLTALPARSLRLRNQSSDEPSSSGMAPAPSLAAAAAPDRGEVGVDRGDEGAAPAPPPLAVPPGGRRADGAGRPLPADFGARGGAGVGFGTQKALCDRSSSFRSSSSRGAMKGRLEASISQLRRDSACKLRQVCSAPMRWDMASGARLAYTSGLDQSGGAGVGSGTTPLAVMVKANRDAPDRPHAPRVTPSAFSAMPSQRRISTTAGTLSRVRPRSANRSDRIGGAPAAAPYADTST